MDKMIEIDFLVYTFSCGFRKTLANKSFGFKARDSPPPRHKRYHLSCNTTRVRIIMAAVINYYRTRMIFHYKSREKIHKGVALCLGRKTQSAHTRFAITSLRGGSPKTAYEYNNMDNLSGATVIIYS